MTIEHAPPQQSGITKVERCLTCRKCNNEAAFEARAGSIKLRRQTALKKVEVAGLPARTSQDFKHLVSIAAITDDEFLVELKTAYLVAYATLGNNYIFDSSLENLRRALDAHSIEPLYPNSTTTLSSPICARVTSNELAPQHPIGGRVLELSGPFTALGVGIPATHPTSGDPDEHVVIIPKHRSPNDLYERLAHNKGGKLSIQADPYVIPSKLTVQQNSRYTGADEQWSVETNETAPTRTEHDTFMESTAVQNQLSYLRERS